VQKACSEGSASGCSNLGFLLESGVLGAPDPARAAALYQQACDDGAASACHNLAVLLESGEGAARDVGKAAELYEAACARGHATSCHNLGLVHERRAQRLYEQACEAGSAEGCGAYGDALVLGRGTKVNRPRGVEHLRRGCRMGDAWSCGRLKDLGETP
jgi:hypothetical protein